MNCEHKNWEIGLNDAGHEEASCKECCLKTSEMVPIFTAALAVWPPHWTKLDADDFERLYQAVATYHRENT